MANLKSFLIGGTIFASLLIIGLGVAIFYAVNNTTKTTRLRCNTLTTEPPGSYFRLDGLSTFEIQCYDESHEIKWIHNGYIIGPHGNPYTVSFGNKSTKLIFKEGKNDMNGIYTCDSGSFKKSIQVEFQGNTIYFEEKEEHVTAEEGSRVQFSCSAHSTSEVHYKWFELNYEITNNKDVYVKNYEYNSFLNFDNVKIYDHGEFRCIATNVYGEVTKTFYLTVTEEKKIPYFYKSDEYVKVVEGSNLQLHCLAQSKEPLEYTWAVEYIVLKNTTEVYSLEADQSSTLFIGIVEYSKVYQCFARNVHGELYKKFHVSVVTDVPPYFKDTIEYRKVLETQSVQLFCRAQSKDAVTYDWLDEGYNPLEESNNTDVEDTYDASSLFIRNAGENVSAVYRCNAANIYGTSTKTIHLSVLMVLPRFPYAEESIELREGEFFQLPCYVWNDDVTLTWFDKDFNQITEKEESQRYVSKDGSYLYFYNMRPIDGGDYYCTATNIYGSRTKVFHMSVLTNKRPFFGENKIHVDAVEGSSVQLYCSARSDEKVNYYWRVEDDDEVTFYKNITITSDVYFVNSNNGSILILDNVEIMTNEIYRCIARNSYGGTAKLFSVSVEKGSVPIVENDYKNITILKGSNLQLPCWHPLAENAEYQWTYRNGEILTENSELPVYVSSIDHGSVLMIKGMENNYSGIYSCNVSNSFSYNITDYDIQINTDYGIDPDIRGILFN